MLIRLVVSGAAHLMRANNEQARRIGRLARKHGLPFAMFADWQSSIALAECAAGYDLAANTPESRFIPEDEAQAKAREVSAEVGHILNAL